MAKLVVPLSSIVGAQVRTFGGEVGWVLAVGVVPVRFGDDGEFVALLQRSSDGKLMSVALDGAEVL